MSMTEYMYFSKVGLSQRFEVAAINVGVGSSIKIFSKIQNNN